MINKLVIFLLRKKLGVKLEQPFRFANQRTKDVYWFDKHGLIKFPHNGLPGTLSGVSLNWLLNEECKVDIL